MRINYETNLPTVRGIIQSFSNDPDKVDLEIKKFLYNLCTKHKDIKKVSGRSYEAHISFAYTREQCLAFNSDSESGKNDSTGYRKSPKNTEGS